MGTDIHLAVEVYDPVTRKWAHVPELEFCERDYLLFAILANVRNGHGPASCKGFYPISPITKPRGLPNDIDQESLQYVGGYHAASFLSLKEILDYDWNQNTLQHGYVDLNCYKDFKQTQEPPSCYCGDVSGKLIKKMSMEEADEHLKNIDEGVKSMYFIYVEIIWPVVFKEGVSGSWWSLIEEMKELADDYDNVRIVFNFDS